MIDTSAEPIHPEPPTARSGSPALSRSLGLFVGGTLLAGVPVCLWASRTGPNALRAALVAGGLCLTVGVLVLAAWQLIPRSLAFGPSDRYGVAAPYSLLAFWGTLARGCGVFFGMFVLLIVWPELDARTFLLSLIWFYLATLFLETLQLVAIRRKEPIPSPDQANGSPLRPTP